MTSSKNLLQASAGNAAGGTEPFYDYEIENSAHFEPLSSTYARLDRTIGSGSNTTWSWSMWVKPPVVVPSSGYANVGQLGVNSATVDTALRMANNRTGTGGGHVLWPYGYNSGYLGQDLSAAKFRDPSAWYHILWVVDTTESAEADRCKIYVNGVQTPLNQFTYSWPLNGNTGFGTSGNNMYITQYGYVAEVILLDGTATTPTSFGQFKNGAWVPKDPSGLSFGNNGFWLDFADSSNLGNDVSGNGNHFTASNMSSSDQMVDTPTNNFATLNPLWQINLAQTTEATLSDGNLTATTTSTPVYNNSVATMPFPSTGKWYCEAKFTGYVNSAIYAGVIAGLGQVPGATYNVNNFYVPGDSSGDCSISLLTGYRRVNQANTAYGTPVASGSVVMFAVDMDNRKIYFGDDGTWMNSGDPVAGTGFASNTLVDEVFLALTSYSNNDKYEVNFGQTPFAYTPPTDFLALCTANLPEPTIGPNIDDTAVAGLPEEQFKVLLYEGNSTNDRDITGVGFDPDLGIFKNRDEGYGWIVVDRNRGDGWSLGIDTGAQESGTDKFDSFITDGYRIDSHPGLNRSSIVNYSWKAGGTASSNTDGDITSNVSANTDAGISIVTYIGNGSSNQTVGHGLGVDPAMVIIKRYESGYTWRVWHSGLSGDTYYLGLNQANAESSSSTVFNGHSSTTFTVGNDPSVNGSSGTMVAYCFAEVESFSSFGRYTGNGSTDGPFIYTGFRPAYLVIKSSSGTTQWYVHDSARTPYNLNTNTLFFDLSNAESTAELESTYGKDMLSNGFKIRASHGTHNASGATYIYMAFAENPFKYSNAR